jgi:hydroxyacyl-ACP dehydratase HTD2-like protein with hotdog domain
MSDSQLTFAQVAVGDEITALEIEVSRVQMFFFSAATYNGHRIHYDTTWASGVEGYPDIIIQGPLQVAMMSRTITDWMGGSGQLITYAVQNRGSAFIGDGLRFRGTVTGKRVEDGRGLVDLELRGEKADGTLLMPGTACVSLPLSGPAA